MQIDGEIRHVTRLRNMLLSIPVSLVSMATTARLWRENHG
jgi:hypothetical protein